MWTRVVSSDLAISINVKSSLAKHQDQKLDKEGECMIVT